MDGVFDFFERFGLGGGYKATGIDYNNISIFRARGYQKTGLNDFGQHFFTVYNIFWTAQRHKTNFCIILLFFCHNPIKIAKKRGSVKC